MQFVVACDGEPVLDELKVKVEMLEIACELGRPFTLLNDGAKRCRSPDEEEGPASKDQGQIKERGLREFYRPPVACEGLLVFMKNGHEPRCEVVDDLSAARVPSSRFSPPSSIMRLSLYISLLCTITLVRLFLFTLLDQLARDTCLIFPLEKHCPPWLCSSSLKVIIVFHLRVDLGGSCF